LKFAAVTASQEKSVAYLLAKEPPNLMNVILRPIAVVLGHEDPFGGGGMVNV
jgi:hypothetical protein